MFLPHFELDRAWPTRMRYVELIITEGGESTASLREIFH